jgi:antitoxin (DNA-binding transcriptional repressor) of toxin-antitoxin stability system
MLTTTVDVHEAETRFKELVQLVENGADVLFMENNKPVARLVPVEPRIAGLHPGAIWTSEDFDEPLADRFWTGEA